MNALVGNMFSINEKKDNKTIIVFAYKEERLNVILKADGRTTSKNLESWKSWCYETSFHVTSRQYLYLPFYYVKQKKQN